MARLSHPRGPSVLTSASGIFNDGLTCGSQWSLRIRSRRVFLHRFISAGFKRKNCQTITKMKRIIITESSNIRTPDRLTGARHLTAAAVIICCVTPSAHADFLTEGLYLEVFGGLHGLSDGDISQSGITAEGSYDLGQLYGATIGKKLTENWAVELEFFYRSNEIDDIDAGPLVTNTDGDFASTNLMFNGVYTFTCGDGLPLWGKFSPYAGFGIGVIQEADIDVKIGGVEQEYDSNWMFAAQIMAGISYEVSENWSLFAEARYHFAGSLDLESSGANPDVEADYDGFSALIGVRYAF